MQDEKSRLESQEGHNMNASFILRLLWDNQLRQWRVVIKPTDGGPPQVFADLEMAFLYIARNFTEPD